MKHFSEDELIAYQMGDLPRAQAAAVRPHLEQCGACAAAAEQIAETLRVFSAEPVAAPNMEHAWGRLRGSLPSLAVAGVPQQRTWRRWRVAGPALLAGLALASGLALHEHRASTAIVPELWSHAANNPALPVGPLSAEPRDPALAAHLAAHLADADRLLTELRHAPEGRLDDATRAQAEQFRMKNAGWVRESREAGDLGDAAVLDRVDRTLTTLSHEPARAGADRGWHVRFEMSTDGLLLDLRVLEQNDAQNDTQNGAQSNAQNNSQSGAQNGAQNGEQNGAQAKKE